MDWNALLSKSNSLYDKLYETNIEFNDFWKNNVLFTWRWWIAVSLIILPWIIWLFARKKESTDRLLYVGFFVAIFACALDDIGLKMNLWNYPVVVFPLMPEFITFDVCVLPVATMLFIQYFPKVNPYIKAIIYAFISSFIFEPLNVIFGLYVKRNWEYYYSFPIMIIIYLVANYIAFRRNKFAKLNSFK